MLKSPGVKMIYLVVLLTLLPFNAAINLTYFVKRDKNKILPSCISEEFERYEPVGWVYSMPTSVQEIPNITSKFIPTINNDYNCKFSRNHICSKRWALKDWRIDDGSSKTKELISDYRWEDLPSVLISNVTKEFQERIEVNSVFKSGISVRAIGFVELFICSGWNPHNHPCYYLNITRREIFLQKYSVLPQNLNESNSTILEHYKAFTNILSHDEWRSFVISFNANRTIQLLDVNLNRIVIEHVDVDNFNPMYVLVRSNEPSLWKFHESNFLYTNTTQISRLGPQLKLFSKDLCISLLVSVCENCEITFFYQNFTERKILKQVGFTENQWIETKLKEENIPTETLIIFVETKLKSPQLNQSGYWAIDNVRICNENEVKVSYLKLKDINVDDEKVDYISCQLIKKPSWRPKKHVYYQVGDISEIVATSNSTSIKLSWQQEDTRNEINYFVMYQANDLCSSEPYNLRRQKSSGFLTTRYNEIIIDNLVPFTLYNITISSVLHEAGKQVYVNTLETEELTFKELPQKIQLRTSESSVNVSWQKVPCTFLYGRLVYSLKVTNEKLNFTKQLPLDTETSYQIDGLQPYTFYSLSVVTARNAGNIYKERYTNTMVTNFTTLPGVAPPVENLELYSVDQNSASLRYDLPRNSNGVPSEVKLRRCNALSFSKCKLYISKVQSCPLWPNKFCVFANYLNPYQMYSFSLSLKNLYTSTSGQEVSVSGYTLDRVPGVPTNVTYKIVDCQISTDYCHLNITWSHPYNENGTITSFNIILNNTEKFPNLEENKYIHEIYKVENKSYMPTYTYQIKYLPYSTYYILYLQSANTLYKSNFTQLMVKTGNLGDHIDQRLKLIEKTDYSLLYKLPPNDKRLDFYILTVLVQDYDSKKEIEPKLLKDKKIGSNLCHKFGNTWISQVVKVEGNNTQTITIDKSEKGKIEPKTKYCITFIITNKYKNTEHNVVYYEKLQTPESTQILPEEPNKSSYSHLYILLLLLLLIPIGFLIYRFMRKKRVIPKPEEKSENVYETLPFDEYENNCVSNDNYDNLLHK